MGRPFLILLALLAAGTSYSQNSLSIIFERDAGRNTRIGTISRGGTLYGSINDLSAAFKLKTVTTGQKIDLAVRQFTLELTADNPFIVIIDQNRNANVVQLQDHVVQQKAFFAPIAEFIHVLDDVMTEDIAYNRATQSIVVGHTLPASPFDITGLSFDEKTNGDLIRIHCAKKLSDYETWTKPIGDDTWLYVTLADAKADAASLRQFKSTGRLKEVLVFQSPTSVQLTFKLKGQITSAEPMAAEGSTDILLAIHRPTDEQIAMRKVRDYEHTLQRERERWKLDVVVIDAGHGGDDPGTIGVMKTKEKDITLAIALKLGTLLENNLPGVRVIYTRKTDEFIELYRRGQIANQAGGKLFISIHCNAMPRKPRPTNGFEIYLLRPGKTENALRIAERENAVVKYEAGYEQRYQKLTEENFILLTMAQSAYVKYSEHFADILQQEMGRQHELENNGIKQAGFYVLVGASMPNVLVETAYLSNKHDEKILRSAKGQQHIAEAIFSAVKRYKKEYEKSLEEGKEIGSDSR